MLKELKGLQKITKDYKKQMKSEGKKAISKGAKELFEKYPVLEAIRWQQWVPGFNDGEPCEFTVGEVNFQFNDKSIQGDEENWYEDTCEDFVVSSGSNNSQMAKDLNKFSSAVAELEDMLEETFGANQEITIRRSGKVTVEDYECGY